MYKLIFSDLDETLLTSDHHVPLVNRQAIALARQKGVKFVPATGRGYEMTKEILSEIGIADQKDEYIIAFNGAMIVECRDFKELYFQGLEFSTVEKIYHFGRQFDVCIEIFTPEAVYMFHANEDEINRKIKQKANFFIMADDDLPSLKDKRLAKIIFQKRDMDYLYHIASQMHSITDNQVEVSYSSSRYLEFNHLGINKGKAAMFLANYLGIPMKETIAIGDNENDISMLECAGVGVAVRCAMPHIQALADDVTQKDFAEGAVAEMIEKYIL